jgi:hypothetical protein
MMAISWIVAAAAEDPSGKAQSTSLAPLPAHSAVYEVLRRGSKVGEVHVVLEPDQNDIWRYHTETVATSMLARLLRVAAEESAQFAWRDNHVLPLTYRQVARAPTRTRYWQHEIDWLAGQTKTQTYEGDLEIPLEENLLDPLTMRLQVAVELQDPDNRGKDLEFRVLERDEIETQSFFYLGDQSIAVPAGCFDAIHMQRFRREGSSRNYDSWHSPRFHWLPLRILQIKDGDPEIDIRLLTTSINLGPDDC